jgi:hypothetical protein
MAKISYSAVVLNEASQAELKKRWAHHIQVNPDKNLGDWKVFCHHATICMGELPPELKSAKGQQIALSVFSSVYGEVVAAHRVVEPSILSGLISNKHFHITIAVNTKAGAKPAHSNALLDASDDPTSLSCISPINLVGTIEEVPFS